MMKKVKFDWQKPVFSQVLSGERVYLQRPQATAQFAHQVYCEINSCRAYIVPWLEWAKTIQSKDDALDYVKKQIEGWDNENKASYAVFDKQNNQFMGFVWIHQIHEWHRFVELGYWISQKYAGKGFTKEAVRLLEKEIFRHHFEKIIIRTDTENMASANLARSLGYFFEGIQRHDRLSEFWGGFRSHNVFTKLADEYFGVAGAERLDGTTRHG